MITSLRTRLMASYAVITVFSILAVSLSANLFLEARFGEYVKERIATEKQQAVATITASWQGSGTWNHDELSIIGMDALTRGFIIRIDDTAGTVVWDARTHNNGMCEEMLTNLAHTMDQRYKGWTGAYKEENFPIIVNGAAIGSVWVGNYGPFWFTDSELYFLASLNQIVGLTAIVALIIAAGFGWLMANRLSRPILQVTRTAHQLRHGDLEARSPEASTIKEIADLALSINSLGHSLSEQEALRRRMTTDISHELRTPLTIMRGQMEAMIDGIWPMDIKGLASCRDEVLRLTRLVGQIEGLAKAEAAELVLTPESIGLLDFVENHCHLQQGHFHSLGISLTCQSDPVQFAADRDKLNQIAVNLLSNAAKYTPAGGVVAICGSMQSRDGEAYAVISVKDTGSGIPPDDLTHIFERFYRVDASRSSASGGAGIGLTIAQSLARLHGGWIEAESVLAQGSEFRVFIPIK